MSEAAAASQSTNKEATETETTESKETTETQTTETKTPESEASSTETKETETPAKETEEEPEAFTLKAPEGSNFDENQLKAYESFAKENGLSAVQAQAIVERDAAASKNLATAWENELVSDKEIGGDNLEQSKALAQEAVKKYFPNLAKAITGTPFENHPALFRDLVALGKTMAPDKAVMPGAQRGHGGGELSLVEELYGKAE